MNFPGWGLVGFLFDVDAGIVLEMLPLLRNVFAHFLKFAGGRSGPGGAAHPVLDSV